jgi:protein-S-isoprenylcysteine O-methyltransferase Ste14
MNKKMSVMGVGGKIGAVLVVYLAAAIALDLVFAPMFRIADRAGYAVTLPLGIALAVVGFGLNLSAALPMLKAYKAGKLVTGGMYRVFANPMYVFMIFVTLPGLLLILNSWLAMSAVLPAYAAYRIFVREEYRWLEDRFGEEYSQYRKTVLVPFI